MTLTPERRKECAAQLTDLMRRTPGVRSALLALRDGRPLAQAAVAGIEPDKFAAMGSSLLTLGASVLRELGGGVLDHVLVEGVEGRLALVRIPESGGLLILCVLATADARLGLVLGQARTCAVAVGEVLRRAGNEQ